jgi:hypothetical protein
MIRDGSPCAGTRGARATQQADGDQRACKDPGRGVIGRTLTRSGPSVQAREGGTRGNRFGDYVSKTEGGIIG